MNETVTQRIKRLRLEQKEFKEFLKDEILSYKLEYRIKRYNKKDARYLNDKLDEFLQYKIKQFKEELA